MRTALDDVSFLARSDHRVTVLDTLREGERTRSELRELTDIPQATLGRILEDFGERGWVRAEGRTYALTRFGAVLAAEFESLLASVDELQRVDRVARLLPDDAPDPRLFADATVVVPTRTNVLAHVKRAEELLETATDLRVVTSSVFPDALRTQRERSVAGDQRQSVVVAGDALDVVLADPQLSAVTRDLVASGNVEVYRYDGSVDCLLSIVDGTAVLGVLDENGVPCAHIESSNPAVVEWAESTFADYRDRATPLSVDDFPE